MLRRCLKSFCCVWLVFSIAACLLLLGCGRDEPAKPTSEPETAVEGESAPAAKVAWQPPSPVDAQDDPGRPRALPKSNEVVGWIKTKPIRLTPIDEAQTFKSDSGSEISLATFQLKKIARCGYEHEKAKADVLLIECATASDAFGVFSLLTKGSAAEVTADKSVRCVHQPSRMYSGWQGRSFVQVRLSGADGDETNRAGALLANRILFSLPTSEPPMLMQMVPEPQRQGGKLWLVRRTAALKQIPVSTFRQLNAEVMDARLGLDGETFLSVAAIKVAPDEPDNLIWLLECPDEAAAAKVYERYQAALTTPVSRLDSDTILTEPIGHLLLGSWTAGQESIQNLLSQLKQAVGK